MEDSIAELEGLEEIAKKLKSLVHDADGKLLKDHQVDWELVTALATEAAEKSKALGLPTRYNLELYRRKLEQYGRGSLQAH